MGTVCAEVFASFRLGPVIGRGGLGVVHRAREMQLGREVALKLLAPELRANPELTEQMLREAEVQAGLQNPHVVPVYAAGRSDHGPWIAMRLIEGPTLKHLLAAGPLPPRRALRILAGVAHALDAAHARGVVHRDVKPSNILIAGGDHAFLTDFGLTAVMGEDAHGLEAVGTVHYMAPEQVRGDAVDARTDVYALAAVLYECLTGHTPFVRRTAAATLYAHLEQEVPRILGERPDLREDVDELLRAGLAKASADRPASAGTLIRAARTALRAEPRGRLAALAA